MAVPASPVADGEAAEAKVGVAPADARRAGRRRSRLNSRRSHRLRGAYKDNEGGDDDGDTTASTASDLDRAANQFLKGDNASGKTNGIKFNHGKEIKWP